jgi:hypothetical protein
VRVTTITAGSDDEVPLGGRKGLPRCVPSVAGVEPVLTYATEDWN